MVPTALPPLAGRSALRRLLQGPAVVVWLLLASLYGATMTPGLSTYHATGLDDATEFQVVGSYWGFEHSPGYPLWTVLANLFVRAVGAIAPATEPAWRVTLSSMLTALAVLVLFSQLLTRLRLHTLLVAAATLYLGVSSMFWRHAVIAEMYMLNLLLILGTIGVAWSWAQSDERHERRWLIALGLLLGAMAVHHRTGLLVVPGLMLYMVRARPRPWRQWARAALTVGAAGLPMALWYLYLPLSAAHYRATSVGRIYRDIHSVGDLWAVATASEWLPLMRAPTLERLATLVAQQGHELLTPLALPLGLIGLLLAGRAALPFLGTALLFILFAVSCTAYDVDTMVIPLTASLIVGIALLTQRLGEWLARRHAPAGRAVEVALSLCLLLALFGQLEGRRAAVDQSEDIANLPMIEMVRLIAEQGKPISILAYQHSSLATIQYLKARYGYANLEPLYPNKLDEDPALPLSEQLRRRWEAGRYLYYSDDLFDFTPDALPDIRAGLADGRYRAVPTYLDRLKLLMPSRAMPAIALDPQQPLDEALAEGLSLRGYDARWVRREAGIFLDLTLYWQVDRAMAGTAIVSLWPQGEAVQGLEALRFDGFLLGSMPVAALQPGERLRDSYQLRLNEGLPQAPFELQVNVEYHEGARSESRTAVLTLPPPSIPPDPPGGR